MPKIQENRIQNSQPDTGSPSRPEQIERANRFLQSGEWSRAYDQLETIIDSEPTAEAVGVHPLFMAGMLALKLENHSRAEDHFRQVLTIEPDNFDASYNLALLDMTSDNYPQAIERMRRLHRQDPKNSGLCNDMAVLWYHLGRTDRAEVAFRRALRLNPNYSAARNNAMEMFLKTEQPARGKKFLENQLNDTRTNELTQAEIKRWQLVLQQGTEEADTRTTTDIGEQPMPQMEMTQRIGKIAFFGTQRAFISEIADHLSSKNEIRFFEGTNLESVAELMRWADLAWFEWCDDLMISAAGLPKTCQTLCRLHSYEAFTDMPDRVDWSKVDHLLFVNDTVRQLVSSRLKNLPPTSVIHNGVNMDRFAISPDRKYGKKIASVGYINYKKNPALLLYCFKKIHEYDPEYSFHIAGAHQDPRIALYFSHFLEKTKLPIQFDGWVEDMAEWYRDKDFVISTSLFESFHYSIAEGMASGLMPLIHNWYGAEDLYPSEYTFMDPDGCLELLKRLENEDKRALAADNRAHINRYYNQGDKLAEIGELLLSICGSNEKAGRLL